MARHPVVATAPLQHETHTSDRCERAKQALARLRMPHHLPPRTKHRGRHASHPHPARGQLITCVCVCHTSYAQAATPPRAKASTPTVGLAKARRTQDHAAGQHRQPNKQGAMWRHSRRGGHGEVWVGTASPHPHPAHTPPTHAHPISIHPPPLTRRTPQPARRSPRAPVMGKHGKRRATPFSSSRWRRRRGQRPCGRGRRQPWPCGPQPARRSPSRGRARTCGRGWSPSGCAWS